MLGKPLEREGTQQTVVADVIRRKAIRGGRGPLRGWCFGNWKISSGVNPVKPGGGGNCHNEHHVGPGESPLSQDPGLS